jgi:LAO/AO transport system kinase
MDLNLWVEKIKGGDVRLLARGLSEIENRGPRSRALLSALFPHSGQARVMGLTGAPGAGKSTVVSALALEFRKRGKRVAILAVDPTSPFTGGSILGDRIRMQAHDADGGVYIRSMATRGSLGGLAPAAADVLVALDAAGFDVILIETVGVGQAEVDVVRIAGVVALLLTPSSGDDVQTMKAGIMEVADVFVINKADRNGVQEPRRDLEQMLDLSDLPHDAWRPPIVPTVGSTGEGVVALWDAVLAHRAYAEANGQLAERRSFRAGEELREIVANRLREKARSLCTGDRWDELTRSVGDQTTDPWTAADEMLSGIDA